MVVRCSRLRRVVGCMVLLFVAIAAPAGAKAPDKPKLIVALVVDQFAADLFDRYRSTYTGGLKRLSGGIVYIDAYQSHAATETCPGHSTILTGRHPSATGIVGNVWRDRTTGKFLYCVAVPGADPQARGPENLRVDTLGTWLKASKPGARVVSVSGKDRAAIMLAGHHADAVYWWDDGKGFVTSSWAGTDGRAIAASAQAFHHTASATSHAAVSALWPTDVPAPCVALERPELFGAVSLSGHVPPAGFVMAPDGNAFDEHLRASPLFDRMTLDFAERLIESRHLGRGPATDLLAISLSATDYIGHTYGKGGPEMCTQIIALDRMLSTFFANLDALHVPYIVVLTADHGSSDAAERTARNGLPAGRIDARQLIGGLNAHLKQALRLEKPPIEGGDPQDLTISTGGNATLYALVRDEAIRWLREQPHVAEVLTRAEVAAAAPAAGTSPDLLTMAERFHESFDPDRSGDLFVVFDPHWSALVPRTPTSAVAGHGSPWDYDRLVPILFWWPGATTEIVSRPVDTVDIAPTLAAIAGVRTPLLAGTCLSEVANCKISIH